MKKRYTVKMTFKGCKRCGSGKLWNVLSPEGILTAVDYETRDDAQYIADLLNCAYEEGIAKGREKGKK